MLSKQTKHKKQIKMIKKVTKTFKQCGSMILIMTLIATIIPVQAFAQNTASNNIITEQNSEELDKEQDQEEVNTEPLIVKELEDKRTENSNTYLLDNGRKQIVLYSDNIRYKDEEGNLIDYNSELVETSEESFKEIEEIATEGGILEENTAKDYLYENESGDSKQYIPKSINTDSPLLMTNKNYKLTFAPLTEALDGTVANVFKNKSFNQVSIQDETITDIYGMEKEVSIKAVYENQDKSIELEYQSLDFGIKENIILNEMPDSNTFSFVMEMEGMYPKLDNPEIGGGITFFDEETNTIVGGIEAPFMNDATNEAYSEEIHYELIKNEEKDNVYILTLVVDKDYLSSSDRVYPITIDPTATWTGSSTVLDSYVLKAQPTYNYYTSSVTTFSVGTGTQGLFRTYMKISGFGTAISGMYVESAKLTVYENGANASGTVIQAKQVTETFDESTLTWNNKPANASTVYASITSSGVTGTAKTFDLTTWAQGMANGSLAKKGLVLMASSESAASTYVRFYGSRASDTAKRPKLVATYYDGPTTATSVTVDKYYLKSGETLKVNWAGITSQGLSYVQYRVAPFDESTDTIGDTYIAYSTSTKVGTTESGSSSISASTGWPEGKYKIYLRGVDKGGIVGTGAGANFIIDRTIPVISSASLSIATSSTSYSKTLPTLTWNVTEKYLSQVQVSINGGAYTSVGTTNSGSKALSGLTSGQANTINVRAMDKAGNYSAVKSFTYYYDNTAPIINSIAASPVTSSTVNANGNAPNLSWSITEDALSTVQYSINGGSYIATTAALSGSIVLPASSFPSQGTYTITIKATDKAGNSTEKSVVYETGYYVMSLPLDSTLQLTNYLNTTVTWSTSNVNIATVSSSGLVTAKAKGTVTITATSVQDITKKMICTITVTGTEEKYYYGIPGGYAPTGNYSQTFTDMTVPSVLGDLPLSRTYNSFEAANDSIVGKGFHFNYSMRIVNDTRDTTKTYIIAPDSAWWCFTKNTDGTYTAKDCRGTLKQDASTGKYTFETLDQMRYGFTSTGYLEYIEDFKGNRITVTTDLAGKITAMTDSSGLSISFTYSGTLLTKITDNKSGRSVQYVYNNSYLSKVTDEGGFALSYEYASGLLVKISESTQVRSIITYDSSSSYAGLAKSITDAQGLVSTYDYSGKGSRQITITDDTSVTIQYYNTALDILKTTIAPIGKPNEITGLTENTVNIFHEVTSTKDILGNITSYTYDGKGNVTDISYPDGSTEHYDYDSYNNKVFYFDKNGAVNSYTYDSYQNLTSVSRLLNGGKYEISKYEYYTDNTYPIKNLLKKETGSLGDEKNYIKYEYSFPATANVDKTVTTIKCVDGVDKATKVEYDKTGRVIKETSPTGIITMNTYDQTKGLLASTELWDNSQRQQITKNDYDSFGALIKTTMEYYDGSQSNVTKYEYNANGNLIKETNSDGTITEYKYDTDGNEIEEVEKNSVGTELEKTETSYDELGRDTFETTTAINAPAETTNTAYTFDTVRKVYITAETDEFGGVTVTETGWDGRVLKQKNSNGLIQINTYYTSGLPKREEYQNSSGNTLKWTEYVYDTWGRVTKQTSSFDSSGIEEIIYSYDVAGNVLTELVKVDTNQYRKCSYFYDTWGNKIKTTQYNGFFDAAGTALDSKPANYMQTLYDWDGQVLVECKGLTSELTKAELQSLPTNNTYSVTKQQYDNFRRLTVKTDALGTTESYQYDYAGRLIKTTDRKGTVHEIKYDHADRKTEEKSGSITKTYTYDNDGNLASVKEGTTIIEYTYDGSGNVIEEKCGNVVKTFNEETIKEKKTDSTEVVVRREVTESITVDAVIKQWVKKVYNTAGQLTEVYDLLYSSATPKAKYSYDLLGQLLTTTNANGTTETNEYNAAGLVTKTVNKYSGSLVHSQYVYTYYYDSNQKTKTDSTGTTEYAYDGCGQLIKTVLGNRTTQADNTTLSNAVAITIETPTSVSVNQSGQVRYFKFTPATTGTYVIASTDKSSSADPYGYLYTADGAQLTYNDDGNGDLNFKMEYTLSAGTEYIIGAKMYSSKTGSYTVTVTQQSGNANTAFADAATLEIGTPAKVNINTANQFRYFKFAPAETGTYIIFSTDNGNSDPYGYLYASNGTQLAYNDDSNSSRNFTISYTLDAGTEYIIGAKMFSTGTGSYTMGVKKSGDDTVQEYTYDANGNRLTMAENKNGTTTRQTTYQYDKNDRLEKETTGSQETTYTYDANGNMISKTGGIAQIYDALNRMTRYQNGSIDVSYTYYPDNMRKSKGSTTQVWLGDEIALDLNDNAVISSFIYGLKLVQSTYGWYLYNAHGDVTSLADSNGYVIRNYDYDPFGVQLGNNAGIDNNPYRYCGEYYDTESGYTYLRGRYYDPNIGRFINEDPALDGSNWYAYCENDPVNYIDPSGELKKSILNKYKKNGYTCDVNKKYYGVFHKKVKGKRKYRYVGSVYARKTVGANNELSTHRKTANAEYIFCYLYNDGWTINAICGLLGNIQRESRLNPGAWQQANNKGGYGIVQWTPATDFFDWAKIKDGPAADKMVSSPKKLLKKQLKFLIHSSKATSGGRRWMGTTKYYSPFNMTYEQYKKSTKSVEDLTKVFHGAYERSGDGPTEIAERVQFATNWYNHFKKR